VAVLNPKSKLQPEKGPGGAVEESAPKEEPPPPPRNPAKLAPGFKQLARPAEFQTAQRLASQYPEFDGRTFTAAPKPDPGYDWTDDLGRTYDAVGDGTRAQYQDMDEMIDSINHHLYKTNDFTVIDMTGYSPEQISTISNYANGLSPADQATIRRIGF
jgi:hypothetical protein